MRMSATSTSCARRRDPAAAALRCRWPMQPAASLPSATARCRRAAPPRPAAARCRQRPPRRACCCSTAARCTCGCTWRWAACRWPRPARQYVARLDPVARRRQRRQADARRSRRSPLSAHQEPAERRRSSWKRSRRQTTSDAARRRAEDRSASAASWSAYRQDLTSSQERPEVFKLLDADKSGVLDTAEMAAAAELIMSKDEDDDQCVSFRGVLPAASAARSDGRSPPALADDPRRCRIATVADMIRDAQRAARCRAAASASTTSDRDVAARRSGAGLAARAGRERSMPTATASSTRPSCARSARQRPTSS